jgi:hypothetical protein
MHRKTTACRGLLSAFSAVATWPAAAFACSGPGAQEAIFVSSLIALVSWALTGLCFLAALLVPPVRRRMGWTGVIGLFAATLLHPALVFGTLRGDCGYTARWASIVFLPILALVLSWLWRRGPRRLAAQGEGPA